MGQREEYPMHYLAGTRDEGCAGTDDQGKVLDRCAPAIDWIDAFISQESIVHEQSVEKNVDSSDFRFGHSRHLGRRLNARINPPSANSILTDWRKRR
jgi:hypothetical protein